MAGPSKVEFPGQKKQSIRMRGTKQANKETTNTQEHKQTKKSKHKQLQNTKTP